MAASVDRRVGVGALLGPRRGNLLGEHVGIGGVPHLEIAGNGSNQFDMAGLLFRRSGLVIKAVGPGPEPEHASTELESLTLPRPAPPAQRPRPSTTGASSPSQLTSPQRHAEAACKSPQAPRTPGPCPGKPLATPDDPAHRLPKICGNAELAVRETVWPPGLSVTEVRLVVPMDAQETEAGHH